ncbi:MAG TPA: hypothetical protein VF209_00740 [Patescibacteria group bacterium]
MRNTSIAIILTVFLFLVSPVYAGGSNGVIISNTSEVSIENRNSGTEKTESADTPSYLSLPEKASGFISDALTVQTAILALLLPLSVDIVSRISDRYKSEIIMNRFIKEPFFRALAIILLLNITYLLFLSFFKVESFLLTGFSFLLSIASMVLLALFFNLILQYVRSPSFVKEQLFNEAEKIFD